jgi:hypothetical protein
MECDYRIDLIQKKEIICGSRTVVDLAPSVSIVQRPLEHAPLAIRPKTRQHIQHL